MVESSSIVARRVFGGVALLLAASIGARSVHSASLPTGARRLAPARLASGANLRATPAVASATSSGAGDAVYNLKVVTDASPDVSDLGSLVSSITAAWPSNRDKVWALYYWSHLLKRQTAPMVVHGFEVTDPVRNFADYGFTMCSTISGINQALYEALGLRHEYWDICNHTVSQVDYDSSFHMIDSSMSNLVTSADGSRLASIEEVADNGAMLLRTNSLSATSPFGFLTGSDNVRNLATTVVADGSTVPGLDSAFCADGLKRRDYFYNWDAGHRYVLNLKEGESPAITRSSATHPSTSWAARASTHPIRPGRSIRRVPGTSVCARTAAGRCLRALPPTVSWARSTAPRTSPQLPAGGSPRRRRASRRLRSTRCRART